MKIIKSTLFVLIIFWMCYNSNAVEWQKMNMEDEPIITSMITDSNLMIFAGTDQGLYSYWSMPNKFQSSYPSNYINRIVIDRILADNSKISDMYICSRYVIIEFFTSGWIQYGRPGVINPTSICFDKDTNSLVSAYGDTITGGIQKMDYSVQSGWRPLNNGLPIENDSIKAWDIVNKNDTIFVGLTNGLYYSTNKGNQWFSIPEFEGLEVNHFVFNRKNDLYFIVTGIGEKSGLYKNNRKIYGDILPLSAVAVNMNNDVFVSTRLKGKGVFWSVDELNWNEMYDGLDSVEITALTCDKEGFIYAGTNGQGIYKSINSTTKVEELSNFRNVFTFPNPFSATTTIKFNLENYGFVKLSVFDFLGREVGVLIDGWMEAGGHEVVFEGTGLAQGTYFYKMQFGTEVFTGKVSLVKSE